MYREREICTGRRRKKWKKEGRKGRERGEGKERVKEKVVKLEGWGEWVNRRKEKTEGSWYTEGWILQRDRGEGREREIWRNEWRRERQKSIFSAGIRTTVGGEGLLWLPKTHYIPTMIRTPAHTHIHISLRKELIRTVRGLSLLLWP